MEGLLGGGLEAVKKVMKMSLELISCAFHPL